MLSPFECLCGNFILPEPASYVFFYAFSNLRNLLYIITCVDYFAMIQQYGADAVAANLKSWLSETSAMGCGDDITVLIAYFSDDTATESEAATNE